MCHLDNLIYALFTISNIGTIVLFVLYALQQNKLKKLDIDLNRAENIEYCAYRQKYVIFDAGGIKARLERMEKQKAIIAELCDYVYKSK